MVTARRAFEQTRQILEKASIADAGFDAGQLLLLAGGPDVRVFPDQPLTDAQAEALAALTARRAAREPLQYIAGSWAFMDLTLAVGPGVLIPRQDTELAAELAIAAACKAGPAPRVADLCSGTGALALAVATHVPGARVTAVELSPQAFAYLERNNTAYGSPLALVRGDALAFSPAPGSFEVIVSNPPYVTAAEYAALEPELYAEPKMALVPPGGEEDGLLFYRALAPLCLRALAPGGSLIFEAGDTQGPAVRDICLSAGFARAEVHRDLAGNPRAIWCQKASD